MNLRSLLGVAAAVALGVGVGAAGVAAASPGAPPSPKAKASTVQTAAVPAPAKQDDVFVPLTTCRIADTRGGGGAITAGSTRKFQVTGTTGFTAQGGTASGCGIPAAATAVNVSLTAASETGSSSLRVYPTGGTAPASGIALSFTASTQITSSVTAQLGSTGQFTAFVSGGGTGITTQLIADVTGYYEPQIEAYVQSDGSLYSATSRVLSSVRDDVGVYTVTLDTNDAQCSTTATPGTGAGYTAVAVGNTATSGPGAGIVNVTIYDASGALANTYFNLTVTC